MPSSSRSTTGTCWRHVSSFVDNSVHGFICCLWKAVSQQKCGRGPAGRAFHPAHNRSEHPARFRLPPYSNSQAMFDLQAPSGGLAPSPPHPAACALMPLRDTPITSPSNPQAPSGRLAPTATAPTSCWMTRCPLKWTSHCWRLCASRLCRQAHQWGGGGGGGGGCATGRARRRKFQGRHCSGPHARGIVLLPLASHPDACCQNTLFAAAQGLCTQRCTLR